MGDSVREGQRDAAPPRTRCSPAPYSTTMPVTISTGCQLNMRALPSQAKPPRQCWHHAPTKATQPSPRPPSKVQKGRKGRSGIIAARCRDLGGGRKESCQPPWRLPATLAHWDAGTPGRSHPKGEAAAVGRVVRSSGGRQAGRNVSRRSPSHVTAPTAAPAAPGATESTLSTSETASSTTQPALSTLKPAPGAPKPEPSTSESHPQHSKPAPATPNVPPAPPSLGPAPPKLFPALTKLPQTWAQHPQTCGPTAPRGDGQARGRAYLPGDLHLPPEIDISVAGGTPPQPLLGPAGPHLPFALSERRHVGRRRSSGPPRRWRRRSRAGGQRDQRERWVERPTSASALASACRFPWRRRMAAAGEPRAAVRARGRRSGDGGTESGTETGLRGSVAGKRPGGAPLGISLGRAGREPGWGRCGGFGGDSQLRDSSWLRCGQFPFSRPPSALGSALPGRDGKEGSGSRLVPAPVSSWLSRPKPGARRWGGAMDSNAGSWRAPAHPYGVAWGKPEAAVCQTLLGFVTALTLLWVFWLCPALPSRTLLPSGASCREQRC